MNQIDFNSIITQNAALVAAVIFAVTALKEVGLPGKFASLMAMILGIGGAYLVISHSPGIFIIAGILAAAGEKGVFAAHESQVTASLTRKSVVEVPVMKDNPTEQPQPADVIAGPSIIHTSAFEPEPEEPTV